MKIAIATCADLPNLTAGDRHLAAEFEKQGDSVQPIVWTDPQSLQGNWDLILIRSIWDYHKNLPAFLDWLAKAEAKATVLNSPEVIRRNCDKAYLMQLQAAGIACPPSILIRKSVAVEEAMTMIKAKAWKEIVLKPTVSATAYLTIRTWSDDPDLARNIGQIQKHSDVLCQAYVGSVQTDGEMSLIYFQNKAIEFSHAVLKKPSVGDYRVQSDFGGSEELVLPSQELLNSSQKVLEQIQGDWVFARVDWIDWKTKPLLGEVELIEPNLFFHLEPKAAVRLVRAIENQLKLNSQQRRK